MIPWRGNQGRPPKEQDMEKRKAEKTESLEWVMSLLVGVNERFHTNTIKNILYYLKRARISAKGGQ